MINISDKANNLIENLEVEKGRSAQAYLNYAKKNGIKTNDKNSIGRKVLQCHLMKYGHSQVWYKAAENHNVNTKEELYKVYFNQLIDMLKEEFKTVDSIEDIKDIQENQMYILSWYDAALEKECKSSYKGKYINNIVSDFLNDKDIKDIKIVNMYNHFNKETEDPQIEKWNLTALILFLVMVIL